MNILGYSRKQQASFEEVPLNPVDILIAACVSYFDFGKLRYKLPFKISALAKNRYFNSNEAYYDAYLFRTCKLMMKRLMKSERFKNMEVLEYNEVSDEKKTISFAAIALRLGDKIVIAFRGTDPSFVGWKEDFYLSYKKSIRSYSLAVSFVKHIIKEYDEQIIICGHSKGGHISTYILKEIDDEDAERLDGVYDFDGPGFKEENIFKGKKRRLKIYHKIIPRSSLVGILFDKGTKIEIIRSNNIGGVFQHNPFTWMIRKNDFWYAKKRSVSSRYIDKGINDWIKSVDDKEKERFTNILFDALDENEAKDLAALIKKALMFKQIKPFIDAYRKLDKKDRELFNRVGKQLFLSMTKFRTLNEISD